MSLKYSNLDDLILKNDQTFSSTSINRILVKLLANDRQLSPEQAIIPTFWERKWFKDDNVPGYSKGQAVWLNTEDLSTFIENKADDLYNYAKKDSRLVKVIEPYVKNDPKSYNAYCRLLTGYVLENGEIIPSIYDIGDNSYPVQIKISQIDDNKAELSDASAWTDYFQHDAKIVQTVFTEQYRQMLSAHIQQYHCNNSIDMSKVSVEYADISLSNLTKLQKLQQHACDMHINEQTGFDYISASSQDLAQNTFLTNTVGHYNRAISSNTAYVLTGEQPGHYELQYCISSDYEKILSAVANYDQIDQFKNILNDKNVLGNVIFRHISAAGQTGFPNLFRYEPSLYDSIKNDLPKYKVSFVISPISTVFVSEYQTSGYYKFVPDCPNVVESLDLVKEYADRYVLSNNVKDASTYSTELYKYNVISAWSHYWNSGQLEQGGTIFLGTHFIPEKVEIKFKIPYRYQTTAVSYYGMYSKFDDSTSYQQSGNFKANNHYVLNVVPVSDSYAIENVEVLEMKNDGFTILVSENSPRYITYNVIGTIIQ